MSFLARVYYLAGLAREQSASLYRADDDDEARATTYHEATPSLPRTSRFWTEMRRGIISRADKEAAAPERVSNLSLSAAVRLKTKASTAAQRVRTRHNRIINPKNKHKIRWDMFVGVLIFYSVVVIPWRIAYQLDADEGYAFIVDILVDVIFFVDMIVTFFTAYYEDERLEVSHKAIAKKYFRTYFWPDLVSTVPFDRLIPLLVQTLGRGGVTNLRSIKLIRVFRLFRLLKIMRVARLNRKLAGANLSERINPSVIRLFGLMGRIILVAHIVACMWYYINSCDEDTDNWLKCGTKGNLASKYLASFYWTIATMMAVGYGDIAATDDGERVYAVMTEVIGATAFGFIIATVTVIVETLDPEATARQRAMDEIHEFFTDRQMHKPLKRRLWRHFHYYYANSSVFREHQIFRDLPLALRHQLVLETRGDLRSLNLFQGLDALFVVDLMARLKPMRMEHTDVIVTEGDVCDDVYFVVSGRIEASIESTDEEKEALIQAFKNGRAASRAAAQPVSAAGDEDDEESPDDPWTFARAGSSSHTPQRRTLNGFAATPAPMRRDSARYAPPPTRDDGDEAAEYDEHAGSPATVHPFVAAASFRSQQDADAGAGGKNSQTSSSDRNNDSGDATHDASSATANVCTANNDSAPGNGVAEDGRSGDNDNSTNAGDNNVALTAPNNANSGSRSGNQSTSNDGGSTSNADDNRSNGGSASGSQASSAAARLRGRRNGPTSGTRSHLTMSTSFADVVASANPDMMAKNKRDPVDVRRAAEDAIAERLFRGAFWDTGAADDRSRVIVGVYHDRSEFLFAESWRREFASCTYRPLITSDLVWITAKDLRHLARNSRSIKKLLNAATEQAHGVMQQSRHARAVPHGGRLIKEECLVNGIPSAPAILSATIEEHIVLDTDEDVRVFRTFRESRPGQGGFLVRDATESVLDVNGSGSRASSVSSLTGAGQSPQPAKVVPDGLTAAMQGTPATSGSGGNPGNRGVEGATRVRGPFRPGNEQQQQQTRGDAPTSVSSNMSSSGSGANTQAGASDGEDEKGDDNNNNNGMGVRTDTMGGSTRISFGGSIPRFAVAATAAMDKDSEEKDETRRDSNASPHLRARSGSRATVASAVDLAKERGMHIQEAQETLAEIGKRGIIMPFGRWKVRWDIWVAILVLASVLAVPYRLGFEISMSRFWNAADIVTDVCFFLDICFSFRTAYEDETQTYVTVPRMIAVQYARTWLAVDFLSTIPFDRFSEGGLSLKLLRLLRLFRLLKLSKLLKAASRTLHQRESMEFSTTLARCAKLLAMLAFLGHLFGCFFSFVATNNKHNNVWWEKDGIEKDDVASRYVASVYWAFTTMTTVGYGDIVPNTDRERLYATAIMVMGATVFGYIVGSVSTLASNPNGARAKEQRIISMVKNYLAEKRIPHHVRASVHRHFEFFISRRSPFDELSILRRMPQALRFAVAKHSHREVIETVPIFRHGQENGLAAVLAMAMHPMLIGSGGWVFQVGERSQGVHFMVKGIVEEVRKQVTRSKVTYPVKRVLEAGSFFGHEEFLGIASPGTGMRAFTEASMYVLMDNDIADFTEHYPQLAQMLQESLRDAILEQIRQRTAAATLSRTKSANLFTVAKQLNEINRMKRGPSQMFDTSTMRGGDTDGSDTDQQPQPPQQLQVGNSPASAAVAILRGRARVAPAPQNSANDGKAQEEDHQPKQTTESRTGTPDADNAGMMDVVQEDSGEGDDQNSLADVSDRESPGDLMRAAGYDPPVDV